METQQTTISDGRIIADSVNTCDDCFEMIQSSYYLDQEDMISDAYPGLQQVKKKCKEVILKEF
jgi:hypothetical protein